MMVAANWHAYQVLTKRSERVRDLLTGRLRLAAEQANVWWGVSVEDRHFGVPRIGHLQQARPAVSFYPSNATGAAGRIDISGISWVWWAVRVVHCG